MKKLISVFMCLVIFFSICPVVLAEETILNAMPSWTVEKNSNGTDTNMVKINIMGKLGEKYADEKIVIKMHSEGIDRNDNTLQYSEKYNYLCIVWSDNNGDFSAETDVDLNSGKYIVVASSDTMDNEIECEVFIPSAKEMDKLLKGIEGVPAENEYDAEKLGKELSEKYNELGLWTGIKDITDGNVTKIAQYIKDNLLEFTPIKLAEIYNEALFVKGIAPEEKGETVKNILDMYIDSTSLKSNELYIDYDNLSNDDKIKTCSYMTNDSYDTVNEVEYGFFKALSLTLLNNIESYNQIGEIIGNYGKYMGESESLDDYNNLSSSEKDLVNNEISEFTDKIDSVKDLFDQIDTAIINLEEDEEDDNKTSYGGGGNGGIYTPMQTEPAVSLNDIKSEMDAAAVFNDVPVTYWGYESIMDLYNKKIVSGRSNTTFAPEDKITRAEFAKLIVSAKELSGDAELSFKDVETSEWYYQYVSIAVANEIIKGLNEDIFAPNENITRQDAAVMLARTIDDEEAVAETFKDDANISEYAKKAVYMLKSKGLIGGYEGNFNPLNNLTRAEAAQMIFNILEGGI